MIAADFDLNQALSSERVTFFNAPSPRTRLDRQADCDYGTNGNWVGLVNISIGIDY
jgi:hypothetical protein